MIEGLDSATEPTVAQVQAAAAAGRRIWSGYLASTPYDGGSHFGLWHPWSQGAFAAAWLTGSQPLAYCSGSDDPVAVSALARAWSLRPCLDVERGIRPDGLWVQPWIDAAGANIMGLYGNYGVHTGRRAAFHILAAYPTSGDPSDASWWDQTPRPAGPCGWQWSGTHPEFGVSVDSTWFDDWFVGVHGAGGGQLGGYDVIHPSMKYMIAHALVSLYGGPDDFPDDATITALGNSIADDGSNADTVLRTIRNRPENVKWEQLAVDLKAGKYDPVPDVDPVPIPPPAVRPHHHSVLGVINTGEAIT